jgi:hypothetical protein
LGFLIKNYTYSNYAIWWLDTVLFSDVVPYSENNNNTEVMIDENTTTRCLFPHTDYFVLPDESVDTQSAIVFNAVLEV